MADSCRLDPRRGACLGILPGQECGRCDEVGKPHVQDLVNGLDWIEEHLKDKVCIDLDIDRQHVTASGTPEEIDRLIHDEVKRLSSRDGGLMMIYGLYPGVPLENVKALMDAMEKYRDR